MNQHTFALSCAVFAGHGAFIKRKLKEEGHSIDDHKIDPYLMYWALMTFMEAKERSMFDNPAHDLTLFSEKFEKLFIEVEILDFNDFSEVFNGAIRKGQAGENSDIRH